MKFLLGEKLYMTQIFAPDGNMIPVTIVAARPNVVLMQRTKKRDGYTAIQVGAGAQRPGKTKKTERGHFGDLGAFRNIREFRVAGGKSGTIAEDFPRGRAVDVTIFQEGDKVKVSGITKSKGFQGVVKRHGFHGAPATHGTKHAHREPGSIGGGTGRAGGKVSKGIPMAGRMGGARMTVQNLVVAKVDADSHLLALRGAVPGRRGTLLEIRGNIN
ncbi:MAG: 50S ribosomal protein L3 [Patescibacteria group bacterium]